MNESPNGFRAPLVEELTPLFPSYQILSLIAVGGMGAVYHAVQTSLEREVAIKILPVEFGDDAEFCESFKAEAKAMAKFIHPNLISVFDFGEVNGMLFIVMEYVPGESLHDACHGSALDPAEAVRLMTGISQGLAHAHKHGILHRDIKPANILLDADLEPKIGDFGLARPVDLQVKEGEAIFGTPGYTAPEVIETPQSIDHRADIFSLGVLLHELLTGLIPESDPRPPSAIAQCDPRFDHVVQKATHPNPSERYQHAEEITDELEKIASTAGPRILQTTSPTASGPIVSQGYPQQPYAKKGGGGMLVLLLLITGLGVLFIFRDEIFKDSDQNPNTDPVVEKEPEPLSPDPVPEIDNNPEPIAPEPSPVVAQPDPVPVEPAPSPVVAQPDPVPVEPTPVVKQPKFDVENFLTHARSVMIKRCAVEAEKRDTALEQNLADFKREALRLGKIRLDRKWHGALRDEVGAFIDKCENNGNQILKELDPPLKRKDWLVAMQEERQTREVKIDEDYKLTFAKQEKTYLYGLGLKVKALQKDDDPVAVELIEDEIKKVNESSEYFIGLMNGTAQRSKSMPRRPAPAVVHRPKPLTTGHAPAPAHHEQKPVTPEPIPVAEPKLTEHAFLTHARSEMAKQCGPDLVKYDEALRKNLAGFKDEAWKLLQKNLAEKWHDTSRKELGRFIDGCAQNGNRMGAGIESPLKHKKYLIPLHESYQAKEATIDREMSSLITKHEKNYLHGLGLKLRACQKASDLKTATVIQAEMDKVDASKEYFSSLMLQLSQKR